MTTKEELDNHSNQLNPNNEEYYNSRGISCSSDDEDEWDEYDDPNTDDNEFDSEPWPWYGED